MNAMDGSPIPVEFLADTGADRTVLSAAVWQRLGLPHVPAEHQLAGAGGKTASVIVTTAIELPRDDGGSTVSRGQFAAFTDLKALDMSVLGRNVMNLFTLIVDRPRDVVCLLGAGHHYAISSGPTTRL